MAQRSALIGATVRDTTVTDAEVLYVIGTGGFLTLSDGSFTTYDSAFPGPSFFENDAFVIVVHPTGRGPAMNAAAECLDDLHYRWTQFVEAKTPLAQATALVEVENAMSDMSSYHPDYDYRFDGSQMPWQRQTQD